MKNKKVVIWGIGVTAKDFLNKKGLYRGLEIIAFSDNDPESWHTKFRGIQVIAPSELEKIIFDYIVICSLYYEEIRRQLEQELGVEGTRIISYLTMEEEVKNMVVEKYNSSEEKEIQSVVSYFKQNPLNIYGDYKRERQRYPVYRDENEHPYIMFEGKRMYYPDTYKFVEAEGRPFVGDILYEQGDGSPHQYVLNKNEIKEGGVIVDAGVCEGNFALRFIERAGKVYLIEPDIPWMHALRRTFMPYRNKVVFCQKVLTRYDSANTITIDTLVSENIDFIKMDIEGNEIDALMGAKKTLQKSNARCAVCSYHKQNDEENIRFLLETFGYHTSTSKGYMFFIYDENIVDTLDLRKGIVYAQKRGGCLHNQSGK